MELRFDFATDDRTAGFRLSQFELYNWGTYSRKIVKLTLDKSNALLTGDIGSGKSTIVDALTTMLVPHQKIIYNKAAGANTKERSLYSYIVGEYKIAQDENFGNAKAIALRDNSSFTVLLTRFENEGFDESLTLAQFFYISQNQVMKFFIVSQSQLSIQKDFFNFNDIRDLKKRLRATPYTSVYDTFKDYSKDFRRFMGIKNEQALNLFYQTVSLKSIGNLTQFIRTHMLEGNNIDEKIDELCKNFSELNHSFTLVLRAKEQIELLKPISIESKKYKKNMALKQEQEDILGGLNIYFAKFKKEFLKLKLEELKMELTKNSSNKIICNEHLEKLNSQIIDLKIQLEKNGGDRLNQIDNEITQSNKQLQISKKQNETYNSLVKKLGFRAVSNEHSFLNTLNDLKTKYENIDDELEKVQNKTMHDSISVSRYEDKKKELDKEITYLKNNRSNIPQRVSKIRDDMAKSLDIDIERLPFVGELINVKDEIWEGAIERILHSFSLSLLVEHNLYEKVSSYVDKTQLKGKLVYLKVNTKKNINDYINTTPNSLLEKIEVKADSQYFGILNNMLNNRFDIPCVDSLEEFRKYKKALSINGQFKTNLVRHEKDDRFDINDATKWVLGWDNLAKLKQFEKEFENIEEKIIYLDNEIKNSKLKQIEISNIRDDIRDAIKFESFSQIDWYRISKDIDNLMQEKEELEKSNDIIQSLQSSIEEYEQKQRHEKQKYEKITEYIGSLNQKIEDRQDELGAATLLLDNSSISDDLKQKIKIVYDELIDIKLSLHNINSTKTKIEKYTEKKLEQLTKIIGRNTQNIIANMGKFIIRYPVFAKELDANVSSIDEFELKFIELKKDNLPKWEKKFKELFKEKTIQNIVFLQSTLEQSAAQIKKKIDTINKSLKDIEYSDGTFIELEAKNSTIAEIKEFKQNLKQTTQGSIGDDQSYDESKFLEVKKIIDRFNGREGFSDVDKKWRKTVTDVRNWFDFSAIEKYESDESTKEYYAHSGGKSGGQKEKLAYTVLASSLAYQFGLEHNNIQSRSFRFVMIDEAFGRGSDESTKYALRLFEKLKLQLLVITPKQKINVIEPYVKSVHFVHNQDGMDSSLISMKIEEYLKKKKS